MVLPSRDRKGAFFVNAPSPVLSKFFTLKALQNTAQGCRFGAPHTHQFKPERPIR